MYTQFITHITHIYIYTHIYVYMCMCISLHMCIYIYIYTCICLCMYIYREREREMSIITDKCMTVLHHAELVPGGDRREDLRSIMLLLSCYY